MGDVLRTLALLVAVVALALPAAAFDGPTQSKKSAAKQQQKDAQKAESGDGEEAGKGAALVQQAFEGGINAYRAGKLDEAQRAFEAAIRGGLPSSQMPRALYYRGLTFRKQGKPGYAIADLTNALWLKGGLSEAERAEAIKTRALAFNEAGVQDVPPVPQSKYAEAPAMPSSTPSPPPAAQAAAAGSGAAPSAPAAPAASESSAPASQSGVGSFFSSLFGGGSSSAPAEQPTPATTASIENAPPAQESGGWGAATEVVTQQEAAAPPPPQVAEPFVTRQVASVAEPEAPGQAQSVPSGKFRLQVAAVRSRSEAEALAGLLVGRHGEQLGGRQPEVDESVIGSMGTFYRVRLGPYASAKEPEQLCVALRSDGFDCLVVAQ